MIEAMTATISFIDIPIGTGTPTKKSSAWSTGAISMYMIATAIPLIEAIRGFLKIRINEAKSRTVVLKKKGIKA